MAAALLAAILIFPLNAQGLSAQKAVLMDAQTGRLLYAKEPDSRALIASTTKIMTALLICEQCNILDRMQIPKEAVGIEGSSMYLREGEVLTLQELVYGLMLQSGNDAAVALAIYCGGTIEGFAERMNDKARTLGMENTHFDNPHGLDSPGHYSTARDMAILTAYALKNPIFAQIVSTRTITIGNRNFRNHNKLLWLQPGADGVKTGYTKNAGRTLVSSAVQDGRRLVAVTMAAPDDWNDHRALYLAGFGNYTLRKLVDKGQVLGHKTLVGGEDSSVSLLADADYSYPLAADEQVKVIVSSPEFVYAPVVEGDEAGMAYLCIDGQVIGNVTLVYGQTVEMEKDERSWLQKILGGDHD